MKTHTIFFYEIKIVAALYAASSLLLLILPLPANGAATSCTYDSINRLTMVNYGNGQVINYTYDAAGNRRSYTATAVLLPVITTQPVGVSVPVGGSAMLSVVATGTGALKYQWNHNGNPVSGATGASISFTGLNAADAGSYTVVISDSNGSVTSQAVVLTVTQSSFAAWLPAYFASPELGDVNQSGPDADPNHDGVSNLLSFAFGMNPRGPNPTGSMPTASISAQSGNQYATLSYHRLIGASGVAYTVCVSDDLKTWDKTESQIETLGTPTATGDGLTETVTVRLKTPISNGTVPRKFLRVSTTAPYTMPPVIATQPSANSVSVGGSITLSSLASGSGTLGYQWYLNGKPVVGATGASLSLININAAQAGKYSVVITATNGGVASPPVTSQSALLSVLQSSFSGWQPAFFSLAEIGDPMTSGKNADPNHDGVSNWLSFAFGMNPKGANPPDSMPAASIVVDSGNQYPTLTYHRLIGTPSLTYKVCVSDNLHNWDETETQTEQVGSPVATGDGLTETVTIRLKTPISSGSNLHKFLRLKVAN